MLQYIRSPYDVTEPAEITFLYHHRHNHGMAKGVTEVIAIILLLLITIAVIGFATGFFQSIVTTGGQQAQNASKTAGDKAQQIIDYVTSTTGSITVKNAGTQDIDTAKLSFLIDGSSVACNPVLSGFKSPGQTITCLGITCTSGEAIIVSAPGNTVTGTCPP